MILIEKSLSCYLKKENGYGAATNHEKIICTKQLNYRHILKNYFPFCIIKNILNVQKFIKIRNIYIYKY